MTIDDGEYDMIHVQAVRRYRRRKVKQPEKQEIQLDVDSFRQELLDNIKQNPTQIGNKNIVMCWPETDARRRVRLKKYLEKRYNYFVLRPCLDEDDSDIHVRWLFEKTENGFISGRFEFVKMEKRVVQEQPVEKNKLRFIVNEGV